MHDVVPRNPCNLNTRSWLKALTIRTELPSHRREFNYQSRLFRSVKTTQSLISASRVPSIFWHYVELLTSFSGYRKRLPNVNSSWLSRISRGIWAKQKRGNILKKKNNNKRAYLRWMLFTSSLLNGRIIPDKNTNALSSPGIISFIELPSAHFTFLFLRPFTTPCVRWAEQQIRNKISGISGQK